jgi:hypothetical protein
MGLTGCFDRRLLQAASPSPSGSTYRIARERIADTNLVVQLDDVRYAPRWGHRPSPRVALDQRMELRWEPLPA